MGVNAYASEDLGLSLPGLGFDATPGGTRDNLFSGKRLGVGLDTQARVGPFELWTEYLWGRFEPTNNIPSARLTSDGWYAQGSCYLVPKKFQAVVRYETFDPDASLSGNTTDTWLLGLNYYIKDHDIKLQADLQRSDAPGLSSGENRLFTRLQLVF